MYSITLHIKVTALIHKISSSGEFNGKLDMAGGRIIKTTCVGKPDGRRKAGRRKSRWLECMENYLKSTGVRRWRSVFI